MLVEELQDCMKASYHLPRVVQNPIPLHPPVRMTKGFQKMMHSHKRCQTRHDLASQLSRGSWCVNKKHLMLRIAAA